MNESTDTNEIISNDHVTKSKSFEYLVIKDTDEEKMENKELICPFDPKIEGIRDFDESSESSAQPNLSSIRLNPAKNLVVGCSPSHIAAKVGIDTDATDCDVTSDYAPKTDSESVFSKSTIDDGGTSDSSVVDEFKTKGKQLKIKNKSSKHRHPSDSSLDGRSSDSKNKLKTQTIKSKFTPGSFEYIKELLSGAIFSGWINERQWVENIHSYRDIIEVNECEDELNMKLNSIVSGIPGVATGKKWINITSPSKTQPYYRLWVLLNSSPTPGHYWFIISNISVEPQFGLKISLKVLRHIHPIDHETIQLRRKKRENTSNLDPVQEWKEWASTIEFSTVINSFLASLTPRNILEAFRFTIVLSVTLMVGAVSLLRESWHLLLRFIRELGIFMHNATPFFHIVIGFLEKLVGGFYLLVAMVYKDVRQKPNVAAPPPIHYNYIQQEPKMIKYVPPEAWSYKKENTAARPSTAQS